MPKPSSEVIQTPAPDPANRPGADASRLSPLSIILTTMRRRYLDGDLEGAIALARIAAPYLHPRLPVSTPAADLAAMTDADLDAVRTQD